MALYKQQFRQFLQACQETGWRGLVQIAGDKIWAEQLLSELLQELSEIAPIYAQHNVQRLQQGLGTDASCIVINAFEGLNPNLLGMVSASLSAGNVLIVLTPQLNDWQSYEDPDYQRMLGSIDRDEPRNNYFLRRVARFFSQAQQYLFLNQENHETRLYQQQAKRNLTPYQEQQQAINLVESAAKGRARRPVLITADRGRGKSAALGIASANLMKSSDYSIAITSVGRSSVTNLFYHLAQELGQDGGETNYQHGSASVCFYPVDELLQNQHACRLLIIDEAAAIPVKFLQQCAEKFPRIVFSTTVNGYEGSGQGFALRFLPYLRDKYPQLTHIQLEQPLRWQKHDPLEKLINGLLLLNIESCQLPPQLGGQRHIYREVKQAELSENESLLQQFFSILVNAHYQTSPNDLRMLLDHPKVRLFACMQDDVLVAAAMVLEEGGLSQKWQDKIVQGRRPAGHLLTQLLYSQGYQSAFDVSYWRIVRIAVRAELRRQKVGQNLLRFIEQHCSADVLGASFALSDETLPFWQSQNYVLCHLGSRKETSTGQFPIMVLKPKQADMSQFVKIAHQSFRESLPLLLLTQNNAIEAELVPLLLQGADHSISARDRYLSLEFANYRRSIEQVFPSLYRVALHMVATNAQAVVEKAGIGYVLIDKLLLNKTWYYTAQKYQLSGRKAVETLLRQQVGSYLKED